MEKHIFFKICFILTLILICIIPNFIFATDNFSTSQFEGDGVVDHGVTDKVNKVLGGVLYIVRIVGIGVAITILTVIACKYMFASAGDRADIKKHAVPYVVGAVVMMGASGILGLLVEVSKNI